MLQNNKIEQLYIKLSIGSLILLIGTLYIPPQSDINVYNLHTDTVNNLLSKYCNAKIILLGDYNLPGLQWHIVNNHIIPHSLKYTNLETNVLANFSYLNLQQFNIIKNRKNSILDLILSNSTDVLVSCETDTLLVYYQSIICITRLYLLPSLLMKNLFPYNIMNLNMIFLNVILMLLSHKLHPLIGQ